MSSVQRPGVQRPGGQRPGVRRPRVSHRARVAVRLLCASLALLIIAGSGVAWATFEKFTADVPHGSPVPALLSGDVDPDGSSQNILLIGNDTRNGATVAEQNAMHVGHDDGTVNADTMMVLHLPANGTAATLVSFPRDSWVTIPGYGPAKLNAAYPDAYNTAIEHHLSERAAESAGIILVIRTIHQLTGLHIDHYMQVNLLGFYRISEAIGGVTVCLNHAQNKTTEVGDGGDGNSGINLPAGVSVIEGEQALAFVRQRHGLPEGDLDRIKRQQYFLRSAFAKITSAGVLLNPFKLRDLLEAVSSSLLTDPSLDLLSLAQQLEGLTSGHVQVATIPNDGPQVIYPGGVLTAIVQVDRAALPAFIRSLDGDESSAFTDAKPLPADQVTLDVLNGTETNHLAANNATALEKHGLRVGTVGSTAISPYTTVEYPAGSESAAKTVLGAVPGAKAVETPAVSQVTLVLGTNGVQARGALAAESSGTSSGAGSSGASSSGAGSSGAGSSGAGSSGTASATQQSESAMMAATHGLGCIN